MNYRTIAVGDDISLINQVEEMFREGDYGEVRAFVSSQPSQDTLQNLTWSSAAAARAGQPHCHSVALPGFCSPASSGPRPPGSAYRRRSPRPTGYEPMPRPEPRGAGQETGAWWDGQEERPRRA